MPSRRRSLRRCRCAPVCGPAYSAATRSTTSPTRTADGAGVGLAEPDAQERAAAPLREVLGEPGEPGGLPQGAQRLLDERSEPVHDRSCGAGWRSPGRWSRVARRCRRSPPRTPARAARARRRCRAMLRRASVPSASKRFWFANCVRSAIALARAAAAGSTAAAVSFRVAIAAARARGGLVAVARVGLGVRRRRERRRARSAAAAPPRCPVRSIWAFWCCSASLTLADVGGLEHAPAPAAAARWAASPSSASMFDGGGRAVARQCRPRVGDPGSLGCGRPRRSASAPDCAGELGRPSSRQPVAVRARAFAAAPRARRPVGSGGGGAQPFGLGDDGRGRAASGGPRLRGPGRRLPRRLDGAGPGPRPTAR